MVAELLGLVLFLVIHQTHQESCDERVYPSRVEVVNSTGGTLCEETVNRSNCTLADSALTNGSGDLAEEGLLVWDHAGSLTFHFESAPVSIGRVRISYYADPGPPSGLPSITIAPFPLISNRTNPRGTYNISTRGTPVSIDRLKMTFDPSTHGFKDFHLSKVEFYSCRSTSMTTKSPGNENQMLVITVSATVLGILLLLVLVTLVGLICVVLRKRRPTETYRVNRSLQRNTYQVGVNREMSKVATADAKQHELEVLALASPVPPTDPEYATISEWRKISGFPQPQPGIGVNNPFYASSSVSIPNKCNVGYVDAIESNFAHGYSVQNNHLKHGCNARSLQDVRTTGLMEAPHTHGEGIITLSPTGSLGHRTLTLASGGSARNIPTYTVRRNESMRDDIGTGNKPAPPPRPVLLKRGASLRSVGGCEPYLMAHMSQSSPLTQSMRAETDTRRKASRESKDSIEDVGNDNYIIVS